MKLFFFAALALINHQSVHGDDFSIGGDLGMGVGMGGDDEGAFVIDGESEVLARPGECCPNEFGCPENSFRQEDLECYKNFNQCECDYGYVMDNGECKADSTSTSCMNDYQCPENSWRRYDWSGCYDEFESCQCDYGYVKNYKNETCVPDAYTDSSGAYCENDIQCPQYAWRKSGRDCYNSIEDDCWCDEKYVLRNDTCVPAPTGPQGINCGGDGRCLTCPNYSTKKNGVYCALTYDDCECAAGYNMEGDECVEKCIMCPSYSEMKEGVKCPRSVKDCECKEGYAFEGEKCVETCTTDYQCPENSMRKPGLTCYVDMDDCVCDKGWMAMGDMCVQSQCTWEQRPNGYCCHNNQECKSRTCALAAANTRKKVCCPYGREKVNGKWTCKTSSD